VLPFFFFKPPPPLPVPTRSSPPPCLYLLAGSYRKTCFLLFSPLSCYDSFAFEACYYCCEDFALNASFPPPDRNLHDSMERFSPACQPISLLLAGPTFRSFFPSRCRIRVHWCSHRLVSPRACLFLKTLQPMRENPKSSLRLPSSVRKVPALPLRLTRPLSSFGPLRIFFSFFLRKSAVTLGLQESSSVHTKTRFLSGRGLPRLSHTGK